MKKHIEKNKKFGEYLGTTTDSAHHEVDMFSEGDIIHAVYNFGSEHERATSESIEKIKTHPDRYLFTPYLEFVKIF